jgi:hypothetical protein
MTGRARKKRLLSFEIDGATLDSLRPTEAFILGAEWGLAWQCAHSAASSKVWIHLANEERITRMLTMLKRSFVVGEPDAGLLEMSIVGLD